MSRGIGKTQRRILDALAAAEDPAQTVVELAGQLDVSDRQIRRAVHALAGRDLVVLTKQYGGWKGRGEYGSPTWRSDAVEDPEGDHVRYDGTSFVIPADRAEQWEQMRAKAGRPSVDTWTKSRFRKEWYTVPRGMPTGVSLFVWLPDRRAEWEAMDAERTRQIRAADSGH